MSAAENEKRDWFIKENVPRFYDLLRDCIRYHRLYGKGAYSARRIRRHREPEVWGFSSGESPTPQLLNSTKARERSKPSHWVACEAFDPYIDDYLRGIDVPANSSVSECVPRVYLRPERTSRAPCKSSTFKISTPSFSRTDQT